MRSVELDGRRYFIWDVLNRYKEQRVAERKARQLLLFELREDSRPKSQTTVKGRYEEPTFF